MCRSLCRFDALGLVHKIDIDGGTGKVTYLSRKLNRGTEAYISEEGVMPPNGGTFAQPPATGLVGRALAGIAGDQWSKLMADLVWCLTPALQLYYMPPDNDEYSAYANIILGASARDIIPARRIA